MTRFHFERPDGPPSRNAQNILIPLNEFVPPQGYSLSGVPSAQQEPFSNLFPTIGDSDYAHYKFYQIKKGEIINEENNATIVITDTLGPNIFLETNGFDIRAFDENGNSIPYDITNNINIITGEFTVRVSIPTLKDLAFVQLIFGNISASDDQVIIFTPNTPALFTTPLLVNDDIPNLLGKNDIGDWFDVNWLSRIPTTVNSGQVPSTQNDFPLLINSTFTNLVNAVEAELRFAGTDSIQLDYEIQEFNSGSGKLIAWVKKPTISNDDVTYIYYDNISAADEQNPSAVWSEYEGVYHMNQTSFGADSIIDSTGKGNDGTDSGTITSVAGKIGNALNIGILSNINLGNSLMDTMNAVGTVSLWINFNDIDNAETFPQPWSLRNIATSNFWEIFFQSLSNPPYRLNFRHGNGTTPRQAMINAADLNSGEDHLFTFFWDQPGGMVRIYMDGEEILNFAFSWTLATTVGEPTSLGNVVPPVINSSFEGIIDQVEFLNKETGADWEKTKWNNQNAPDTFYAISSSEQLIPTISNDIFVENV